MLLFYLDLSSTLPWNSCWHSLLCLGMTDMVGISLSWWGAWYLPLFYVDSSSTLYTLEFLVADIAVDWAMADGYSSAGRTGLGSAVLAGFIIGEGLPVSPLLGRHLVCLDLSSTLPWHSGWHTPFCVDMVDISLSWWEAWYLPPLYMGSSSISLSW